MSRLVEAAKCLLDRCEAVEELIDSKDADGIVHVIVCRDVDEYTLLITRLRKLALPIRPGGSSTAAGPLTRLACDAEQWVGPTIPWLAADLPVERARKILANRLKRLFENEGFKGKNTLVVFEAKANEWNPDRDRELVRRLAEHCATLALPDTLQVLIVYYESKSPSRVGRIREQRERLAALWTRSEPPTHCGACIKLTEIGADDLNPWSHAISREWGRPQQEIVTAIRERLPDGKRLAMRELHAALDPLITAYAADCLNARERRTP